MDLSLPPELSCDPSALVAFAGLDETKNSVHQDLWKRFTSEMGGNRLPLRFVSAEGMEWPAMKPKRNSYEWFIPKGILKKNWSVGNLGL